MALLSRSIRIVSEGDTPDKNGKSNFPPVVKGAATQYYFGGHTVARQGFEAFHVEGVEFKQLGQGGKLGHYPVHFHMARQTPVNTYIRDSSINEFDDALDRGALHAGRGGRAQRRMGSRSATASISKTAPRPTTCSIPTSASSPARRWSTPRIRATCPASWRTTRSAASWSRQTPSPPGTVLFNQTAVDAFPYVSDWNHPTVFWITNGWNDFIGNMAAGAGPGGACYWLVAAYNSNITDDPPNSTMPMKMRWFGYSGLQKNASFAGSTPLKSFYKNSCTSAPNSFETVGNTAVVHGVVPAGLAAARDPRFPVPPGDMVAVKSIAPEHRPTRRRRPTTFSVPGSQGRVATHCPTSATVPGGYDCSGITDPCSNAHETTCGVTVLDHYTTTFNAAPYNFSALWLRPQWYLMANSVISDVLGAGITFVSGGDYTRSSVIGGYWALALQQHVHRRHAAEDGEDTAGRLQPIRTDQGAVRPG